MAPTLAAPLSLMPRTRAGETASAATYRSCFRADPNWLRITDIRAPAAGHFFGLNPGTELSAWNSGDVIAYFIEVCRRVRLTEQKDRILAVMRTTESYRIDSHQGNGDTGDPWTPVERGKQARALNLRGFGSGDDLVQRLLLTGDYSPGITQRFYPQDPPTMFFTAHALVRKKGGTAGMYEEDRSHTWKNPDAPWNFFRKGGVGKTR